MQHRPVVSHLFCRGNYLQRTAGIGGGHDIRIDSSEIARLSLAELTRGFGLNQVVDPGTSATGIGLDGTYKFKAGNTGEYFARLSPNTLSVREVARVMVGDSDWQLLPWRHWPKFTEHLRHVSNTLTKRSCAGRPHRIIRQQMSILFHRRPASGSIDDDPIDIISFERGDHLARQSLRLFGPARVKGKSAATPLPRWDEHVATLGRQYTESCFIHRGERETLDTSGQ